MYPRLCKPITTHSFFLFGPRGVGKTCLVRELLKAESSVATINLLKDREYLELLTDPSRLYNHLNSRASKQFVFIDEVQRVPALLNIVHDIIEDPTWHKKVCFILTGSSARKLKRSGANLLAGRALVYNLYPLSSFETHDEWKLEQHLSWGSLPFVVNAESDELRAEILQAYIGTYLREEIKEEQIIRQVEPFSRFLESAAQANGTLIQYSNIGKAALVDAKAVARYFEILEDTLIGFFLEPFSNSTRERTTAKAKFYFFDIGVQRALERSIGTPLISGTYSWGKHFEHYVILECMRLNNYLRRNAKFSFLRTKDDAEIDLIIELPKKPPLCVEIKSGRDVSDIEVRKLLRLVEAVPKGRALIIFNGKNPLEIDGVRILPWRSALEEIFFRT